MQGALAASLDAVQSGTASIADCLRRYPALVEDLEPLLLTAAKVQTVQRVQPSEHAMLEARYTFMQEAVRRARPAPVTPHPALRRRGWLALAPAGVAALLFALVAVPVLGSMDSSSLPGEWNYSFKRATERVRLALTTDSNDRLLLRLEFAHRRLTEIERLSSQGHVEAHSSDVAALLRDYVAEVNQVAATVPSSASLPASTQKEIENVASQAQTVLPQVTQSAPEDKPVAVAAHEAVAATDHAKTVAATTATTATTKPSSQASPTRTTRGTATPQVAAATSTPQPASPSAAPSATPSHGTETPEATPSAGTATAAPSPAPSTETPATGTPAPTATAPPASATSTPPTTPAPSVAPQQTPSAVATRPATILPANTVTAPFVTPTVPAATATLVPQRTPVTIVAPTETATPTVEPVTPNPSTTPARTVTPNPSGSPAVESPTSTPAATPRATTPTTSVPTAVATRAAAVATPASVAISLTTGDNGPIRYTGAPAPLSTILAPITGKYIVVYYSDESGRSATWYPGTPAPTISHNSVLTIRMRVPGVLVLPP